jgi:hypothetical protein
MGQWNHLLCETCWNKRNPDRTPVRVRDPATEAQPCCGCGAVTGSGIYVRAEPSSMPCDGYGPVHEEQPRVA